MMKHTFLIASVVGAFAAGCVTVADEHHSIDEQATHVDSGTIPVADINAFCLAPDDQIVAACGSGPGEIKVLAVDGEEIRSWSVDIKPEAIGISPSGEVLVGGVGKLLRYSIEGELIQSADSPHAEALRNSSDELREAAIEQLQQRSGSLEATVNAYKQIIEQFEERKEKGELSEQEERALESLPRSLALMEERLAAQQETEPDEEGPSEEEIDQTVDAMLRSKMRIASISSDGDHTFIATSATVGYGYDIWKLENDFSAGEQIVTGLRGCCGQMDVQCCKSGIYVAENSRHRVVCFDKDGEETLSWGKGDQTGIEGFTSCCNPMNVCFSAEGDVYTAESNTGRIKRFSPEGELLAYVGDVKLVPGCKNVSIAVTSTGDRVYMLDITRGHIVVMTKKSEADTEVAEVAALPGS